jgi:hypothetical protein
MTNRLCNFGPRRMVYLLAAISHLARARLDFARRSAPTIVTALRDRQPEAGPRTTLDLALVKWAMGAAACRVPWRADCLIQSMAADRWLRGHGITPAFRLGVTQKPEGGILAHAWIEAEGTVITGGLSVEDSHILIAS